MKIKINKFNIIQESKTLLEPFYVYHIGKKGYKDIRPLIFRNDPDAKKRIKRIKKYHTDADDYIHEINAFFGPITYNMLNDLKKNGFKEYQNIDDLYIYKINLNNPKVKSRIKYLDLTSTPQQINYDKKFWPKFYKIYKKYSNLSTEEFFKKFPDFNKKKKEYFQKRKKYLESLGIKRFKTLEELKKLKYLKDYQNTEKYFKKNISCGNKEQYASCIPHVQFYVTGPIPYETVYKLKDLK